jgi:PIN domain nuclease of toxin-antitoxin system
MNLVLDTHALLWLLGGDENLSKIAKKEIQNPENTCFLSSVSLWEIAIKISIGKLNMKSDFKTLPQMIWENGIEMLPIEFNHYIEILSLPFHHKDWASPTPLTE